MIFDNLMTYWDFIQGFFKGTFYFLVNFFEI